MFHLQSQVTHTVVLIIRVVPKEKFKVGHHGHTDYKQNLSDLINKIANRNMGIGDSAFASTLISKRYQVRNIDASTLALDRCQGPRVKISRRLVVD